MFTHPDSPARVRDTLGSVPLVVTTRDPVARAWSHYLHLRRKGYTAAPLREAVRAFPEIVEASCYARQIARWRAALPDAPVVVLALETLTSDREAYTTQLCRALGLDARPPPASLGESNAAGVPPSFHLARAGRLAATALRSAGAYALVAGAKRLGAKRVFFGVPSPGGARPSMTAEDRAWLAAQLPCEEETARPLN